MTMQAVKDKVYAKVLKKEQKTKGGLIVPETVKKQPQLYGLVISVGNDVKEIISGDEIMFHDRGGQVIVIDEEEYRILAENEIYGIVSRVIPTNEPQGE